MPWLINPLTSAFQWGRGKAADTVACIRSYFPEGSIPRDNSQFIAEMIDPKAPDRIEAQEIARQALQQAANSARTHAQAQQQAAGSPQPLATKPSIIGQAIGVVGGAIQGVAQAVGIISTPLPKENDANAVAISFETDSSDPTKKKVKICGKDFFISQYKKKNGITSYVDFVKCPVELKELEQKLDAAVRQLMAQAKTEKREFDIQKVNNLNLEWDLNEKDEILPDSAIVKYYETGRVAPYTLSNTILKAAASSINPLAESFANTALQYRSQDGSPVAAPITLSGQGATPPTGTQAPQGAQQSPQTASATGAQTPAHPINLCWFRAAMKILLQPKLKDFLLNLTVSTNNSTNPAQLEKVKECMDKFSQNKIKEAEILFTEEILPNLPGSVINVQDDPHIILTYVRNLITNDALDAYIQGQQLILKDKTTLTDVTQTRSWMVELNMTAPPPSNLRKLIRFITASTNTISFNDILKSYYHDNSNILGREDIDHVRKFYIIPPPSLTFHFARFNPDGTKNDSKISAIPDELIIKARELLPDGYSGDSVKYKLKALEVHTVTKNIAHHETYCEGDDGFSDQENREAAYILYYEKA